MWLCTKHGFFSIVRKGENQVHVRARVRADIERLRIELDKEYNPSEILEWPDADYRYRIICGDGAFEYLMQFFTDTLDYENFKERIASLPDQRDKGQDYHTLWYSGVGWQNQERERIREANGGYDQDDIARLIRSSADDVKCSMGHSTAKDLPLLHASLKICQDEGMKTKAAHLARRIAQLTK